ncbi:phosphoribosylformylglycinamidine cyclo-ligase [Nitrosomonas marina]|uniref:Phosphoribosylformylglycinamidine cyclo-ligase n=1 Tax=Nitrosomonas marina TaxID=917 RepID=A0A1H8F3Y4_9PROT|nr:phosphoribosylformylglycinamidine cyclo-ligase [Nitrosomonas marina]SEN25718.1 phosphoribosylformylglycinamidine cyclo-ligase [Nitrosomonas marina]
MTAHHSDDNSSSHELTTSLSYRDAGVSIDAGNDLVQAIKPLAKRTQRPEVLAGIGGFGALFELSGKYRNPVLVSGTDGVGTKLKLAFQLHRHDTIGIDLVAMSVNDILVSGAEPLFFLDYYACGKLDPDIASAVVSGVAAGCEQAGCALIGGETAEMPGMYSEGEYDLAGFAVGIVEKDKIINGSDIQAGDAVIGLASSGAHANGFSLIRKIITTNHINLSQDFHGKPLSDIILAPTKIYVKPVLSLMKQVSIKGLAHITGGGLTENLPRILPIQTTAELNTNAWDLPILFDWLQQQGHISDDEMFRVFNCGIGMVIVVAADQADKAIQCLQHAGETVFPIGKIKQRTPNQPAVILK